MSRIHTRAELLDILEGASDGLRGDHALELSVEEVREIAAALRSQWAGGFEQHAQDEADADLAAGWIAADLRREWWINHGCDYHALYGDDGEMWCNRCVIDFKNTPIEELRKIIPLKRLERAAALRESPAAPTETLRAVAAAAIAYVGEKPLAMIQRRDAGEPLIGAMADPRWVALVESVAALAAARGDTREEQIFDRDPPGHTCAAENQDAQTSHKGTREEPT